MNTLLETLGTSLSRSVKQQLVLHLLADDVKICIDIHRGLGIGLVGKAVKAILSA